MAGAVIKGWFWFFLITACVSAFLVVAGNMGMRQAVVVGIVFAIVFRSFAGFAPKQSARLEPYWVRIQPRWYELLTDYRLIKSGEEWDSLRRSLEMSTERGFSALKEAVWYSLVSQSEDGERTLVYYNSYHVFVGEIDFRETLNPLQIIDEGQTHPLLREYSPELFVKAGSKGYDLGLTVPNWWWERVKSTCPPCLEEKREHDYGTVRLVLARVPYKEFVLYWDSLTYDPTKFAKLQTLQKEAREKFGWVSDDRADDFSEYWPTEISTKYFRLSHKGI